MRLRGIVLPTCSSSTCLPPAGPRSESAWSSASGSGLGVYEGCTPFGTTTIRFAGTIAADDQLVARGLAHAQDLPRGSHPAISRRPSARWTIEPP